MATHEHPKDTVTIAPSVLLTIIHTAALSVEGVIRTTSTPTLDRWLRRTTTDDGIEIEVNDEGVRVEVYLVVDANHNLYETSQRVQQEIARTIKEYAGMKVLSVNVHIEDVNFG
ncbi:MAG: hypothetical protein CUN55_05015 [Phototrophicales bacterium]|nr:MAG: hypothetical protein CUN55_05015 [Phototrophicales bacterium]